MILNLEKDFSDMKKIAINLIMERKAIYIEKAEIDINMIKNMDNVADYRLLLILSISNNNYTRNVLWDMSTEQLESLSKIPILRKVE
jgi:hypothetical protein